MSASEHWEHLEKLLAEAYRRELDQEENVWRSLPFFSATLALQIAVLLQFRDPIVLLLVGQPVAGFTVLAISGAAGVAVLACLLMAIRPMPYQQIAEPGSPVLFVSELEAATGTQQADAGVEILANFRTLLISQYASSVAANRRINRLRGTYRTGAGLALLASVAATLILVAMTLTSRV